MLNLIISLCERHGFLQKVVSQKSSVQQLKVGPVGSLLLHNLKNEWHYNIVTNKENTVFFADKDGFLETFQFVKNICLDRLPFGIAEIKTNQQEVNIGSELSSQEVDFENYFCSADKVSLKCNMFVSCLNSTQFFHQFQRQRRIWWRKFSPNPGRYSLTDIKTEENNNQTVQIVAKYPWNSQLIENISLCTEPQDILEMNKFKEGKKTVQSHCIVSSINLSTMLMNSLCDAYDKSEYKGNVRCLMRFHRKLAPYSISFAISTSSASVTSELSDLALYLTKQLRANHISTLLLPSSSRVPLEAQWKQYDELGVPYNILLNEKTLKDGLAWMRSRDTTLKEQVHVSEIVSYVGQLFRNY